MDLPGAGSSGSGEAVREEDQSAHCPVTQASSFFIRMLSHINCHDR